MSTRKTISGVVAAGITAAVVGAYALFGGGGANGRAFDTAGSDVSVEQAQAIVASGVTLGGQALSWWPSCSHSTTLPSNREANLRNMAAGGLATFAYILVDSHSTGAEAVDRAYNGIPRDVWNNLQFAAIDFELPTDCYNAGTRISRDVVCDALDELSRLGAPRVLYTSYGEWGSRLDPGNPLGCPNTYLYVASWGTPPELLDFNGHPFGGWQSSDIIMKQYTGDTNLFNVYVDNDSFDSSVPFPWFVQAAPVYSPWSCGPDGDAYNSELKLWFFNGAHIYDPEVDKHYVDPLVC